MNLIYKLTWRHWMALPVYALWIAACCLLAAADDFLDWFEPRLEDLGERLVRWSGPILHE